MQHTTSPHTRRRQQHNTLCMHSINPPTAHAAGLYDACCLHLASPTSAAVPTYLYASSSPHTHTLVSVTGLVRDTACTMRLNLPPALHGLKPGHALSAHKLSGALLLYPAAYV